MRNKNITETELFRGLNILLLDSNKEHLEDIKEQASLLANVTIDNSALFRGIIEYFYKNPKQLKNLIDEVKENKGHKIVQDLQECFEKNMADEDIYLKTGIGIKIIQKIRKENT